MKPGMEREFETAYGKDGDWVKLFRQNEAFVRADLIRDLNHTGRYLTLDFWKSSEAYDRFREHHAAEYKNLDEKCEKLTENEREVGRFEKL